MRPVLSNENDQLLRQLIGRVKTASQNLGSLKAAHYSREVRRLRRVLEKRLCPMPAAAARRCGIGVDASMACVRVLLFVEIEVTGNAIFISRKVLAVLELG